MLSNRFLLLLIIITIIIIHICDDNKKLIEGLTFKWYDENNQVLGTDYNSCINGISKLIKSRAQTNQDEIFRPSDYNNIQTCANKFNEDTDVVQKALVTKFSREAIDRVYSDKLSDNEIYETQGENQGEVKQELQSLVDSNYNNQSSQCAQQEGSACPSTCENKEGDCSNCTNDCLKAHKYIREKNEIDEEWGDENNPIPRKYYALKRHRKKAVRDLASLYIQTYGENVARGQNLSLNHCIGKDSDNDQACENKSETECNTDVNCVLYKSAPCAAEQCEDGSGDTIDESSNFARQNLINKRDQIYNKINITRMGEINDFKKIGYDTYCDQVNKCQGANATGNETQEDCTGDGKTWIENPKCMPDMTETSTADQIKTEVQQKLNQSYQNQNNINTYRSLIGDTTNENSICGGICVKDNNITTDTQADCTGDNKTWDEDRGSCILNNVTITDNQTECTGDDKRWDPLTCFPSTITNESPSTEITSLLRNKLTELNSYQNQLYPKSQSELSEIRASIDLLHGETPSCNIAAGSGDTAEGRFHCQQADADGETYTGPRPNSRNLSLISQKTSALLEKIAEYKAAQATFQEIYPHFMRYEAASEGSNYEERITSVTNAFSNLEELQGSISLLQCQLQQAQGAGVSGFELSQECQTIIAGASAPQEAR